jgi:hypothetical protein
MINPSAILGKLGSLAETTEAGKGDYNKFTLFRSASRRYAQPENGFGAVNKRRSR